MLNSRKADMTWSKLIGLILALAVLGVGAYLVYKTYIIGGKAAVGSCGGIIESSCDIYYDSNCPPDSKSAIIDEGCPKGVLKDMSAEAFITAQKASKDEYDKKVEALDELFKAQGMKLTAGDKEKLKYDFFGRCCIGVKAPETAK